MCRAVIAEYVAAHAGDDGPSTPGRALRRLHHTQRGEDLVHDPAETIVASTKRSIPCSVDLSVYGNGVSVTVTGSCRHSGRQLLYCFIQ